jgi:hypothetical protein
VADVTSPFGFPYPEDNDFVRDGAQDIENLATGVNDYLTGGYLYAGTRYFFSNGSFAKADPLLTGDIGLRAIRVRCQGGGGGGGGAQDTGANASAVGLGGGGGGYAESFITDIAGLNSSVTVTRGAGGPGGVGNANGSTGAASSFGSLVIGDGGLGGARQSASSAIGNILYQGAASAGASGTGDLIVRGSASGPVAFRLGNTGAGTLPNTSPGSGGDSHLGSGGVVAGFSGNENGVTGNLFGGGGSGASNMENQSARTGGAGANGIVIIDCFV